MSQDFPPKIKNNVIVIGRGMCVYLGSRVAK